MDRLWLKMKYVVPSSRKFTYVRPVVEGSGGIKWPGVDKEVSSYTWNIKFGGKMAPFHDGSHYEYAPHSNEN